MRSPFGLARRLDRHHLLAALALLYRTVLFLLRLPALPQLLVFYLGWRHAYHSIFDFLFNDFRPAFPPLWIAWVAFLVTLPPFAALQLVWLLVSFFVRRRLARKGTHGPEGGDGYMMLQPDRGEEEWAQDPRARSPRPSPRALRSPNTLLWAAQIALCVLVILRGLHEYRNYEHPGDVRFRPALRKALADPHPKRSGYAPRAEKIFIAAAFHQNELVLPYWTKTMLDTITWLGADNVFVSIVENYSNDKTPDLLRAFEAELDRRGVKNRILIQDETVKRPPDMSWNPRIEFLAAIRNQALEPLLRTGGYDRVLFSNDIYIEPESVLELLETRDGDYDFACGLDFGHFGAYDMWVLRDRAGRLTAAIWPYFFDKGSYDAIKKEDPVPVFACWNGIVAFRADPVLPVALRSNATLPTTHIEHMPPSNHPWTKEIGASPAVTPPLRFRASAEGECYSSESFLLPYDFRRVMALDKVYANPRVVCAYVWKYYVWNKWVLRARYVKWFVERVYDGAWMQYARMIVGDGDRVWSWDGVDCHPWW
ncbi:cryptococcal mannosyltransferase 1-domain-containing protein [Epithele typhae]|uniref:cryptococcal mannosyltransferase 1-domain-containing protein n=1 Tax=Epithele typhae TaxID=378194 RepID=UPI00200856AA|nr:cryptococcal mannosyltransferase 1-domain-containing protein [Epithele typhae]KAH9912354.1 cryptococcal mannosyltransferase 1-domain-containing protein [Epithele typhae]